MEPKIKHRWDLTPKEAMELQRELARAVSLKDVLRWQDIKIVAGVDVAYSKISGKSYAAVVVFDFNHKEPIARATAIRRTDYPYIPGLLSFREAPAIISALRKIKLQVDLLVCDGQGIAHPRACGLASHLGVLYDLPAIGCAKTILFGSPEKTLPDRAGSYVNLLHPTEKKIVASLLRTKDRCRPIIVSPGHKISLSLARRIILHFCDKYRLPEILRQPHLISNYLQVKAQT